MNKINKTAAPGVLFCGQGNSAAANPTESTCYVYLTPADNGTVIWGQDSNGKIHPVRTDDQGRLLILIASSQLPDTPRLTGSEGRVQIRDQSVDTIARPIGVDQHNTLNATAYSQIGRLYSVADTGLLHQNLLTLAYIIDNPSTSSRILYLEKITGGNVPALSSTAYVPALRTMIYRDVQTRGTAQGTPCNMNFGYPNNSIMLVSRLEGMVNGTPVLAISHTSGQFSVDVQGQIIVPPGHNIAIQFTTDALNDNNQLMLNANILWYELDK
ncbi:MAG TPA: hypothetical protein PKA28_06335 [Methylomusa anaerophila]|uniref:Uncharacterized protein n=1 Tax=Methylomusa anaerophila TaxID=1930071 RepID=A0A348ALI8_9FIRM|nr:hypothetical protein [Methylomusa anaerophila]BBB91936.1 hypothetical protein MAMMFC1_02621 [Methylomusa anaerophila]HML88052.1 hypothetical protein [Methylomusa anaerophila]